VTRNYHRIRPARSSQKSCKFFDKKATDKKFQFSTVHNNFSSNILLFPVLQLQTHGLRLQTAQLFNGRLET
ncbi:hypothetical protein, partial [Victivallis vadensis]|uniref:hypothetical protein n=1 Tax=Victivallis vadensis TaxID=172901 RepID=UPI00266B5624